jgi:drug/metabolite transporter (DMT)-like permease
MPLPLLGEGFALGAAICWAVGPLIAYRGIDALGTFRFSQFRYCISAIILFVLAASFGSFDLSDGRSVVFLIMSGVVGVAFGELALFQAIYLLGPRIAPVIFSLHAPITAFLGAAIFAETISRLSFAGVLMAVAGVCTAIIFRSSSEKAGGEWHKSGKIGKGVLLAVTAVVFQVTGALLAKEVVSHMNPLFASFLRTGGAAVAFLPVFALWGERARAVQTADLRFVLYSAAVSTVGGMTFLLAAFAYTQIFRAVVITSLSPVLYILIMGIFRGERFPLGAWLGTLVAVCGVVLTIASI